MCKVLTHSLRRWWEGGMSILPGLGLPFPTESMIWVSSVLLSSEMLKEVDADMNRKSEHSVRKTVTPTFLYKTRAFCLFL